MPTVPELKKLCKDRDIKGYSKLNKAALLAILGRSPSTRRSSKGVAKVRRSGSKTRRSGAKARRSGSKARRSGSKARRSGSKARRSGSKARRSGSKARRSASKVKASPAKVKASPAKVKASPVKVKASPVKVKASTAKGKATSKLNVYTVIFVIKYTRNNDDSTEKDPTASQLERYVKNSSTIPENPTYFTEFEIIKPVTYIGKLKFQFTCETKLSAKDLAEAIIHQSLADGEWEATPGDGSFVYPTKDGDELGLLSFNYITVTDHSTNKTQKFNGESVGWLKLLADGP